MSHAVSTVAGMNQPLSPVDESPSDRDVLDAVITMAALVAKADGWVAVSEREALYRFVVGMSLKPEPSRVEVLDMFDRRIRDLRATAGANVLERIASAVDWGAGPIVEVGERVARADGLMDPRERYVLQAVKTMMMVAQHGETWRSAAGAPQH